MQTDASPSKQAMTPHHVDTNMKALALAEERGSWHAVGRMLEGPVFDMIRPVASAEVLAEIEACTARLAAARAYEAVHGRGALWKHDHWFNKKLEASCKVRNVAFTGRY